MAAHSLVADKSSTGHAGPIAEAAGEGLVCVGCWGFTILPPSPFVFKVDPVVVLEGEDNLVVGMYQGLATSGESRQWQWLT